MAKDVSNITPEIITQFFEDIKAKKIPEVLAALARNEGILDIAVDEYGNNSLHLAAQNNQEEITKAIITKNPRLTYALNNDGKAPEELAVEETADLIRTKRQELKEPLSSELDEFLESSKTLAGRERAIDLLSKFPNIASRAMDEKGNTALHYTAETGDEILAKAILERTPGLAIRENNAQETAEDVAKRNIPSYIGSWIYADTTKVRNAVTQARLQLKVPTQEDRNSFLAAVVENKADKVKLMLTQFPSITEGLKDKDGNTPLHIAAYHGNTDIARKILDTNPRLAQEPNNKRLIPEEYAKANQRSWVGWALGYKNPLDVGNLITQRRTQSKLAVESDKEAFLGALKERNQEGALQILEQFPSLAKDILDKENNTALHLAIKAGAGGVVDSLIKKHQANIYQKNSRGDTALSLVDVRGTDRTIQALVRNTHTNLQTLSEELEPSIESRNAAIAAILATKPWLKSLPNSHGITYEDKLASRDAQKHEEERQKTLAEQLAQAELAKQEENQKKEEKKSATKKAFSTASKSKTISKAIDETKLDTLLTALQASPDTDSKALAKQYAKERNSAKLAKWIPGFGNRKTDMELMVEAIDELKKSLQATDDAPHEMKEIKRYQKKPKEKTI